MQKTTFPGLREEIDHQGEELRHLQALRENTDFPQAVREGLAEAAEAVQILIAEFNHFLKGYNPTDIALTKAPDIEAIKQGFYNERGICPEIYKKTPISRSLVLVAVVDQFMNSKGEEPLSNAMAAKLANVIQNNAFQESLAWLEKRGLIKREGKFKDGVIVPSRALIQEVSCLKARPYVEKIRATIKENLSK